MTNDRLAGWLP